jgi:TatD DNase family protein
MIFADTHTHLYLEEFNADREESIKTAIHKGITYLFLPNIDSSSIDSMLQLTQSFPDNCFAMMGLHPSSVKMDFEKELKLIEERLEKFHFVGIGETGIDLYWSQEFKEQQYIAFRHQIRLAKKYQLPIIIHVRNSFEETLEVLADENTDGLTGIFHCFPGTYEQAQEVIGMGFKIGIGGVVTFKNAKLAEIVKKLDLNDIVLETDSPYLAPVPFRGKRNESAYIRNIAEKIAEIKNIPILEVAQITTHNALKLFGLGKIG